MLTSYSIAPLEPGQVLLTLPLAQLLDASLSAERWQEFAREIVEGSRGDQTRPSAGLMALRNAKGYFIGLFRYHVQLTLRHGRTLAVDDLVVADEELHATALLVVGKGLRELAQCHQCSGVEVALHGGPGTLRQLAVELGSPTDAASLIRAGWRVDR